MTIISPDEWARRIPWHIRARVLASIERAIEQRRRELARLDQVVAQAQLELPEVADVLRERAKARLLLERSPVDPEGPARLALLNRETWAARPGLHRGHDALGHFTMTDRRSA